MALTAVSALSFTLGALFPGRFTAPVVAVGISVLVLAVFSRAVSEGGTSVFALSPDGVVPWNDAGVFYPVAPDVSIVQVMFFAGAGLGAIGLPGLSPRVAAQAGVAPSISPAGEGRGCAPWQPPSSPASIALAVIGFGLAATAKVSPVTGGVEVPALHDDASDKPIPYTPVCADASGGSRFACTRPSAAT